MFSTDTKKSNEGDGNPQTIMDLVNNMVSLKKWRERSDKIKGDRVYEGKEVASGGSVFFRDVQQHGMMSQMYMTVQRTVKPEELVNVFETEWKLPVPTIILQVISGVSTGHRITDHGQLANLQNGIITAASKTEMWVVTNGVNAGIAKVIGTAVNCELQRRKAQTCHRHPKQSSLGLPHLTLLGIVPTALLRYPELFSEQKSIVRVASVGNVPNENKYELNAHHSHFLIVQDSQNTVLESCNLMLELNNYLKNPNLDIEEVTMMAQTMEKKSSLMYARPPMVALLVGGGYTSTQVVRDHLKSQVPVVVLKGSGGAADLLAFAFQEISEQPRHSWDPEYMETFIKPELSKRISTFFKKYRDDSVGRNNFRQDILNCIEMSLQDTQVLLTFLDIDSQDCDLSKLNEHLLRGLVKGEKRETTSHSWQQYLKKDLYLTIDWNCPHIALSEVLAGDIVKSNIDAKMFESALLRLNREAFIELFLDHGFEVRLFLTNRRLLRLFEEGKNAEFFQSVCLDGALGYTSKQKQRGFLVRDLNWLIYQMTNIKNMIQLRDYIYDAKDVSIETEVVRSEERNARNALVVWAVLMNRHKLAKVLWKHSDYPIQLALVISMMYTKLLGYVKEKHITKHIEDLSTQFGDMAVGILDLSFEESSCRAFDVLSQEVPEFNSKTVVEMAVTAHNRKFIAHACCQKWLTSQFYGDIRIRELKYGLFKVPSFVKIFLSAVFLFPAFMWIVFTPPENRSSGSSRKSTSSNFADNGNLNKLFADEEDAVEVIPSKKAKLNQLFCPAETSEDTHLNLVTLCESRQCVAQSGSVRCKLQKFLIHATAKLRGWKNIVVLWQAPVTKFWTHQVFYIVYLALFSVATLWQSCGNIFLDMIIWIWTILLFIENCIITYMQYMHHGMLRIQWFILESAVIALFILLFLVARILPSLHFHVNGEWVHADLLSPYNARIITCLGLLYFYYRFVWIYLPISPTLGRLLFRIQLMVTRDFLQFLRLTMIFIISSGIVIHSAIFPDYPMGDELIRRVFHRSWFSLFAVFIADLEGDKTCAENHTVAVVGRCLLSKYESPLCPVTGTWPYLLNIQFMIILKLILLTLLYALFSDTAAKFASDADSIWRFQRYQLVQNFVARPSVPAPLNGISIPLQLLYCTFKFFVGKCTHHKRNLRGYVDGLDEDKGYADCLYWQSLARQFSHENEQSETAKQTKKVESIASMLGTQNIAIRTLNARITELELTMTASKVALENILHSVCNKQEAFTLDAKQHLSRQSTYPETIIKRFPVADKYVSWDVIFTDYNPVVYNKPAEKFPPDVRAYVDNDNFIMDSGKVSWNSVSQGELDRSSWTTSKEGVPKSITTDSSGVPLNPMGRTGMRGRGCLARLGPNHCCMLLVTKWADNLSATIKHNVNKILNVLTITTETGHIHLPMGFEIGNKNIYSAVRKCFFPLNSAEWTSDEMCRYFVQFSRSKVCDFVSIVSDSLVTKEDLQVTMMYRGYLDDDRNTDNAWIEAEVWHLHYPGIRSYPASDDNGPKWSACKKDLTSLMPSSHAVIVTVILSKFPASL